MSGSPVHLLCWPFTIETPGAETRDAVSDELTTGTPTPRPAVGMWKPADDLTETGGAVPELVGKLWLWVAPGLELGAHDIVRLPACPIAAYSGQWVVIGTPRHVPNPRTHRIEYVKALLERST